MVTFILCLFIILVFVFGLYLINQSYNFINKFSKYDDKELLFQIMKLNSPASYALQRIKMKFDKGEPSTKATSDLLCPDDFCYWKGFSTVSYIKNISPFLIGLGIFGTFLGLTIGVQSLDVSTSAAIQKGIESLLQNVGTAFWTSLIGMGLSIIYSLCTPKFYHDLNRLYEKVLSALEDSGWIGVWDFETERALSNGEVSSKLIRNSDHITTKIDGLAEQVSSQIATIIGDRLESYQQDLMEAFQGGAGQAASEGALRAKETYTNLVKSLEEVSKQINESMSDLTSGLERNIIELNSLVGKIQNTASVFDDQINSMGGTIEKLGIVDDSFNKINNSFIVSTETLNNASGTLSSAIIDNKKASSDFIDAWRGTNDEIKTLTGKFAEIERSFNAAGEAVGGILKDTIREVSSFHNAVSDTSVTQMREFTNAINDFSGRLTSAASDLQEVMQNHPLSASAVSLSKAADEFRQSIHDSIDDLTVSMINKAYVQDKAVNESDFSMVKR